MAQQRIAAGPAMPTPIAATERPTVVATTGRITAAAPTPDAAPVSIDTQPAPVIAEPRADARPRDIATLSLPASGVVEVLFVRVGDRVHPGDALLTFNDEEGRRVIGQLRVEADSARSHTGELERALKTIDASIEALTADAPAAGPAAESTPSDMKQAIDRAQSAYNEAVAREQRARALEAHGVSATQELEASQVAVRAAAADLALARREADAATALASAQALQVRIRAESALADQQRERQAQADELAKARLRQREADTALSDATAHYKILTLRAPAAGVVAEVAVQPGDRTLAGTPLVKLAAVEAN
jgi:multidrug resistance efflux pump